MNATFHGWPADGPAFLTEIATDNTRAFWAAHGHRHAVAVLAPMRELATALEPEFGPLRVFRPQVNRRFRPAAAPYRSDTGAITTAPGACVRGVVLSGAALSVTAGCWRFDGGQLRRFRAAVDGPPGGELEQVLAAPTPFTRTDVPRLRGVPRGFRADHPRIGLLRLLGLQVGRAWPVGPWLASDEPRVRVRDAWRAAVPLARWLDEHVGATDPVAPRPRPAPVPDADAAGGAVAGGGVAGGAVAGGS